MNLDDNFLTNLNSLLQNKQYEYTDMNDGTGVIISIETGKIITLNGLGNKLIAKVVSSADTHESEDIFDEIAQTESATHQIPIEQINSDIAEFFRTLSDTINKH